MLSPSSFLLKRLWIVANAWQQDNAETRTAVYEFLCSHPFVSGGKEANKGPLCDSIWMFTTCRANGWHIFRSAHSLEWRLTIPSNPQTHRLLFCLSWQLWSRRHPFCLCFIFIFGMGVESFSLKRHVFLISGLFEWKLLKVPGSVLVAGCTLSQCCLTFNSIAALLWFLLCNNILSFICPF